MNDYTFTTGPNPQFGNPFTPFSGRLTGDGAPAACVCRSLIAEDRALIGHHADLVGLARDGMPAACAAGEAIPWQGSTADLFRLRLDECTALGTQAGELAEATRATAWSAGA